MSDLHDRLRAATGKTTYRKLGELTDTHPETVRRYMQGQSPSAPFLAQVCAAFGICGEWLLTGKGPMRTDEMRQHALKDADASELLGAIAANLTDLCQRMERLEHYVQGMDTRIRASSRPIDTDERDASPTITQSNSLPNAQQPEPGSVASIREPSPERGALRPDKAVGRIRDAVAKRALEPIDRAVRTDRS